MSRVRQRPQWTSLLHKAALSSTVRLTSSRVDKAMARLFVLVIRGDLGEILSEQVSRYLDSSQDVERDETEQPQRDSNPCRHLERVVS
jgi:hypothetical protein